MRLPNWIPSLIAARVVDALVSQLPRPGALYEVRARPSAAGTGSFFTSVHALLRSAHRAAFAGSPWLSFEIARTRAALRYQLWIPGSERTLVERLLRATYEELELVPVAPCPLSARAVAVTNLRLTRGRYLPIKAEHSGEPLTGLL